MRRRYWMMSLASVWAWLTLGGFKLDELRRARVGRKTGWWSTGCRFEPGDRVLIYEAQPVGVVTGIVEVEAEGVALHYVADLLTAEAQARHRVQVPGVLDYAGECRDPAETMMTVIRWREGARVRLPLPAVPGERPRAVGLDELRRRGVTPSPTWIRAPDWLVSVTGADRPDLRPFAESARLRSPAPPSATGWAIMPEARPDPIEPEYLDPMTDYCGYCEQVEPCGCDS